MLSRIYNITRRGLACVAYPYLEAMRRPGLGGKHGGKNSHVFFYSKPKLNINAEFGELIGI